MQLINAIVAALALTGVNAAKPKPTCKNSPPGGEIVGACYVFRCNKSIDGPVKYRTTATSIRDCAIKNYYSDNPGYGVKFYKPNKTCTFHDPPAAGVKFTYTPNKAFDSATFCGS